MIARATILMSVQWVIFALNWMYFLRTCAICTNRSQGVIFFDSGAVLAAIYRLFLCVIPFYYIFFKIDFLLESVQFILSKKIKKRAREELRRSAFYIFCAYQINQLRNKNQGATLLLLQSAFLQRIRFRTAHLRTPPLPPQRQKRLQKARYPFR